mmetsp:Transcript_74577/g.192417  ORF Transcript_74577/g.192417 Transcript_74577/m.192417 type:complete len:292 (-) Transcript_74577:3471-4346(-)
MNCEPWRLLAPSLPHIWTKMRKQKKAKPSSPCGASFSLTCTRFAGTFSAWRNWLNWKSTLSESMMSVWYLPGSRLNEGTTSGCVVRMCARATSWRSASNCGASSSRNSRIFPRAWMAMKVSAASTAPSMFSLTPSWIHSWIHAQDCFDSTSSSGCVRMKASYWPPMSQSTVSIEHVVWLRCTSARTLKYESSGKTFMMRTLNCRSEIPLVITSFASSLPCTASASSTPLLRTGIHILGITSASASFSLTSSKGRSWNVTEPANSCAKAARRSRRTVTMLLVVPANSFAPAV